MAQVVHRACPACDMDNDHMPSMIFLDTDWPIKKCSYCEFVYLEDAPNYERLVDEFAWEKTSASETIRRFTEEPVKQAISKRLKQFRRHWLKRDKLSKLIKDYFAEGNVVDIGCAGGGVLVGLDKLYTPHGIEISRILASSANEKVMPRGGYVVHDSALSGLGKFSNNYFTGVILSAFLEHEIQPKLLLKEVSRTLKPDGHCIIKVPNYSSLNRVIRGERWCGYRLPDHVNYFTPSSLLRMCKDAGLSIKKFSFADHLPTSDNMWIVVSKAGAMQ